MRLDMKEWNIFLISFGGVLVMMSHLMAQPLYLLVSGLVIIGFGIKKLKDSK